MNRPKLNRAPECNAEWVAKATAFGVANRSLKSCPNLKSGSNVTDEQFLLFRTICPRIKPFFQPQLYGLAAHIQQARGLLGSCPQFQAYLASIRTHHWHQNAPLGRFQIPLEHQFAVVSMETDEASVNASLIELLNAITDLHPAGNRWWTLEKRRLTATFRKRGYHQERQYRAYTDGQLEDTLTRDVKALVECKVGRRDDSSRVVMQEVAELVAWIRQYPDPPHAPASRFRPVFSQNHTELYVSFFTYTQNWERYLKGRSIGNAGLATMQTYGPWITQEPLDVFEYGVIALAIALSS